MKTTAAPRFPLSDDLEQKACMLDMAGDPTRIRILCLLFEEREACVSDIASGLQSNVAAVSHHLQLMKDSGLLSCERQGQNVCYSIVPSRFSKRLKKLICD